MDNRPDPGVPFEVTGGRQKAAWAERLLPPVEQLAGDIWSVPVPIPRNPLRYTLSYLIPGESGLVVVDPGWDSAEGWDALCRGLTEAGASPADVTGVVATHVHADHHGMTGRLKAASDAWVAMHPAERDSLPHHTVPQGEVGGAQSPTDPIGARLREAGASANDVRDLTGLPDGQSAAPRVDLAAPDILLEDGDHLPLRGRDVVTVWTPGHTPGHICLAESSAGVILTGDHVLPRITPNIGLHGRRPGQAPLAEFLASLKRLAAWDDHEALPAHEYRFRGLARRTDELRAHHSRRLEEILFVVEESFRPTLWEVTARLSWSRPWDQVGRMRVAALMETAAHVDHLVDAGLLTRCGGEGRPIRVARPGPG